MRANKNSPWSPKTLPGKLILLITVTTLLSMLASWVLVSHYMRDRADRLAVSRLESDAGIFGEVLKTEETPLSGEKLARWANLLGIRLTVMTSDGDVLADSEIPGGMIDRLDNHLTRPEIRAALAGGFGVDKRYSESTKHPYLYYAAASDAEWGPHRGIIIRCSLPMSGFYAVISRVRKLVFAALLMSGMAGLAVGVIGIGRITKPIMRLTEAARRGGKTPDKPLTYLTSPIGGSIEIEELARALREEHEAAARATDDLERERNQLKAIVESAPCGLMLIDTSGQVTAVNEAFSLLLREPHHRVSGTAVDSAVRAPELIELINLAQFAQFAQFAQQAQAREFGEVSFSFRNASGERFYKARSAAAGKDTLILLDDETERRLDEEARKAFVADAGHELQTPLTSISVASELLMGMESSTADEREPYISEIMRQRERMSMLVDDMLLLSRLESGVPSSEPVMLDLSWITRECAEESKSNPAAKDIAWSADIGDGITVPGRREEIRRAISNLLDNAVKYTAKRYRDSLSEKGGKISVKLETDGESAVLSVTDNGVGIPKSLIGRVFERFARAVGDRSRQNGDTGGYGLGLSIVRRVVESHGGDVSAYSDGGVTRFVVTLPLSVAPGQSKRE